MKFAPLVIGILMFNIAAHAHVGGVDGGGGRSVVCRDPSGAITSAETLDLYESRVMYGLNIEKSPEPMEEQIRAALDRIPGTSRGLVEYYVNQVLKNMRITPPGTELLPINDSFEVMLPKNCEAEQLANYYNDNLILVSGDLWPALSETDKAALILHEAVYAANRLFGAKDSRQSRHVVAHVFAADTIWTDVKDGVPETALTCTSPSGGLYMWAYRNPAGGWTLQFNVLGKGYVFSKKTFTVRNPEFDFEEAKTFPVLQGDDLVGSEMGVSGLVSSNFEGSDFIKVTKRWEALKDSEGQVIKGYQTPRYYLSWLSGTFPQVSFQDHMLNCSVVNP